MDDLELIRSHAPDAPAPDAERKRRARLEILAAAAAPKRRFGWPSLPARHPTVFALILAVAAVIITGGPLSFLPRTDPAAAAALQRAGSVAAEGQALDLGDGYVYTRTEAMWLFQAADWLYLRPLVRDFWIAADGSGRIRETVGEPIFLSEADRQAWESGDFTVYALNEVFGPGELEPQLGNASLPTDVDALQEVVRRRAAATHPWPRTDTQMFVVVGDLLRDPLTPPDVRAALFRVAARIPGIQLLGETTDRVGRAGVAVAITELQMTPFARQQIITFDPATSALLEERTVGLWPYAETPAPFDWGYTTYLESKVVPALPAD